MTQDNKESACNAGELHLIPESRRSPGEGNGYSLQPTPVFLSGEFHGHRSLADYSLRGHKELVMTERL